MFRRWWRDDDSARDTRKGQGPKEPSDALLPRLLPLWRLGSYEVLVQGLRNLERVVFVTGGRLQESSSSGRSVRTSMTAQRQVPAFLPSGTSEPGVMTPANGLELGLTLKPSLV